MGKDNFNSSRTGGNYGSPVHSAANKKNVTGNRLSFSSPGNTLQVSGEKEYSQQHQIMMKHPSPDTVAPELDLDETLHIREVFAEVVHDEYITDKFGLQVMLSLLGFYPSDEELSFVLNAYENKISVSNLCNYLRFYKKLFQRNAQRERRDGGSTNLSSSLQEDMDDTVRAFVYLGGNEDCTGTIAMEDVRRVCENFGLNIDVDAMLTSIGDPETQTTLTFAEFYDMCLYQQRDAKASLTNTSSESISGYALMDLRSSLRALTMDLALSRANHGKNNQPTTRAHYNSAEMNRNATEAPGTGGGFGGENFPETPAETEEKHLQSLRIFLFPEAVGMESQMELEGMSRRLTPQFAYSLTNSGMPAAEKLNAAKREKVKAGDDLPVGGNTGNYRAPSPIILSLRNITAARERRLRAFSQKSKMKGSRSRGAGKWGRNSTTAGSIDDD